MKKKTTILVLAVVGILTVGIAFGAFNIANAHNGTNPNRSSAPSGRAMGMFGNSMNGYGMMAREGMDEMAEFLGISDNELISERRSGKSLAEIAKAHGKSAEELKAFVEKEFNDHASELLKEGKITQTQFNEMKEHFEERINDMINESGMRFGRKARGNFRRGCFGKGFAKP